MMLYFLGDIFFVFERLKRRILYFILRSHFKSYGENLKFCPENSQFTYNTISLGNHVQIGSFAIFMSTESIIDIGNHVMFGPKVTIIGGNHNTSKVGSFMSSIKEKRITDDQPVIIEDDVWVGANSVILKGVTIGRGSIISAGSVVTRSCPPYSIIGGVPARLIKWRWSFNTIIEHEANLYPVENQSNISNMRKQRSAYEKLI